MDGEIVLVFLSGIFNQGSIYFDNFMRYLPDKPKYSCWPFMYPRKHASIMEKPDLRLGKICLKDNVDELCSFLEKLFDNHRNAKFVLVGHSMGAMVIQLAAERLGSKIHGMVLMCPVPSSEIKLFSWDGLMVFGKLLKYGAFWNKPVRRSFNDAKRVLYNDIMPEHAKRAAWEKSLWESGRVILQATIDRPFVDHAKISIPTLVIGAKEDKLINEKVVKLTGKKYGGESMMFSASHDILYGIVGRDVMLSVHKWIQKSI